MWSSKEPGKYCELRKTKENRKRAKKQTNKQTYTYASVPVKINEQRKCVAKKTKNKEYPKIKKEKPKKGQWWDSYLSRWFGGKIWPSSWTFSSSACVRARMWLQNGGELSCPQGWFCLAATMACSPYGTLCSLLFYRNVFFYLGGSSFNSISFFCSIRFFCDAIPSEKKKTKKQDCLYCFNGTKKTFPWEFWFIKLTSFIKLFFSRR